MDTQGLDWMSGNATLDQSHSLEAEYDWSTPSSFTQEHEATFHAPMPGSSDTVAAVVVDNDEDLIDLEDHWHHVPNSVVMNMEEHIKVETDMVRAACELSLSDKLTVSGGSGEDSGNRGKDVAAGAPFVSQQHHTTMPRGTMDSASHSQNEAPVYVPQSPQHARTLSLRDRSGPPQSESFRFTYETPANAPEPLVPPFVFVHSAGYARVTVTPRNADPVPIVNDDGRTSRRQWASSHRVSICALLSLLLLAIIAMSAGLIRSRESNTGEFNDEPSSFQPVSQPLAGPGTKTSEAPSSAPFGAASPVDGAPFATTSEGPTFGDVSTGSPTVAPVLAVPMPTPAPQQTLPPMTTSTDLPTLLVTTRPPTVQPTEESSSLPTSAPSDSPTSERDNREETIGPATPVDQPTRPPRPTPMTVEPTREIIEATSTPTTTQSFLPSHRPSLSPTVRTQLPTKIPTGAPTYKPSAIPSLEPTRHPSSWPTPGPTLRPTAIPSQPPSLEISVSPTFSALRIALVSRVTQYEPDMYADLVTPGTPEYEASDWLTSTSTFSSVLAGSDEKLVQRLVLATLFISTNGSQWRNSANWLSDEDECLWFFTGEDSSPCYPNGLLRSLRLERNGLDGQLPKWIGLVSPSLRFLYLRHNMIGGSVPTTLARLTSLDRLVLTNNTLFGEIPTELFRLTTLENLGLGRNMFSGSVPARIGDLSSLDTLGLEWNQFSGPLPSELGRLSNLRFFAIDYNGITNGVPSELGSATGLENLNLSHNMLTGEVPTEICALRDSSLVLLEADCSEVICSCCTNCCSGPSCDGPLDWGGRQLQKPV